MVDDPFITNLLYEEEGTGLDFKSEQYRFIGALDDDKSELLKDILAFANAFRRSEAYILVGVAEKPGGKVTVVGVADHLKDADLQQFVNAKTNAPVEFSYAPLQLEGKSIGVIRIPLQERPRYLTNVMESLRRTPYISVAAARPQLQPPMRLRAWERPLKLSQLYRSCTVSSQTSIHARFWVTASSHPVP